MHNSWIIIFILLINLIWCQTPQITFQSKPYNNGEMWEFSISAIDHLDGQEIISMLQLNNTDIQHSKRITAVRAGQAKIIYNLGGKMLSKGKYKLHLVCPSPTWDYYYEFTVGTAADLAQQRRELSLLYERYVQQVLELAKKLEGIIPAQNQNPNEQYITTRMHEWRDSIYKIKADVEQARNTYWAVPDLSSTNELSQLLLQLEQLWELQSIRLQDMYNISLPDSNALIRQEMQKLTPENQIVQVSNLMANIQQFADQILQKQNLPQNLNAQTLQEDLNWFHRLFQDLDQLFRSCENQGATGRENWNKQSLLIQNEMKLWELQVNDYKNSSLAAKYKTQEINLMASLAELKRNWDDMFSYCNAKIQGRPTKIVPETVIQNLQMHINILLGIPRKEQAEKLEIRRQAGLQAQKDYQLMENYWKELLENIQVQKDLAKFSQWYKTWQTKLDKELPHDPTWQSLLSEFVSDYNSMRNHIVNRAELELQMRQLAKAGPTNRQPGELETAQAYIVQCNWGFRLGLPKAKKKLEGFK